MERKQAPRVVVIGAGCAGVGAVGVLRAGGISDVTVLEGAEQPGGRIKSVMLDKGFVELGAQFLHGENDVFRVAEREGMLKDQDSDDEDLPDTLLQYRDYSFCTSDGKTLSHKTVKKNLQVLEDMQTAVNVALSQGKANDVNVSVGQFFRDQHDTCRKYMLGTDDVKNAMFRWLEVWDCQDAGGDVDDMSVPGIGQYQFCPGNGTRETTRGMEAVFQCLFREIVPPECLRLKKGVKTVYWQQSDVHSAGADPADSLAHWKQYGINNNLEPNEFGGRPSVDVTRGSASETELRTNRSTPLLSGESRAERVYGEHIRGRSGFSVRIECEDGELFSADHVIVTSSIGFLTANAHFFQPQLPQCHKDAINTMGFGNVAKMFLFWDQGHPDLFGKKVEGMVPLWMEGAHPQLRSASYVTKMSSGRQWYQDVCSFNHVDTHDFCIVAWVAGEAAIIMESLPESEVKAVLHELLTLFLKKPDLPAPCRLLRTEWHTNRYTRGAYSYLATGVPLEQHQVLSQPLPSMQNPVLQLAGEACSKQYYSTAHGALQSGQDAAHRILRHYNAKARMIQECRL